ncbi:MAG: MFS transporter [Acidobacteriota bacterium]
MSPDPDPRTVAARHFRRNYICGLLNGAFFGFVDSVASPYLVLSLFVNTLGGSNFLVGLLPAINNGGWFLPQFLISHRLQQLPRKKSVYDTAGIVRIFCWLVLVLSTFFIGNSNATLLLLLFFIPYTLYSLAAGFAGAPFMDIVAKTIPVNRRGTFFGRRDLTGAVMAIGGSYIVSYFLNPQTALAFPINFAYLFLIAGIAVTIGLGAFSFVVEPVEATPVQELTFRDQLHAARAMFLRNQLYRRFLLTRVAIAAADIATPFYAIYATRILGIPLEVIGVYIAATTGASLLTNPLLSRLSDQRGHRIVLLGAATGMVTMPALAMLFGLLPAGSALGLPFGLVFVVLGITRTAGNIAYPSYLLEIAPAGERPLYIGFTNTILGVATFLPILGGILLDLASFRVILLLTLVIAGIAWWLAKGMAEPRQLALHASPRI